MNDGDSFNGVFRDTESYRSELFRLLSVYWSNRYGVRKNLFCFLSVVVMDPKERRQKSKALIDYIRKAPVSRGHLPLSFLFLMIKTSDNKSCDDQNKGYTRHCDESLSIFRRVDLLPHDEWKPCLEDIRHFVHTAYDKRSLLVIFGANLVSPAVIGCQLRYLG